MLMEELKHQVYEVMYKYEKSFGEVGVMANLTQWAEGKKPLLELLRRHPNWREEELAIVFDVSEQRAIDPVIVDETKFELVEMAEELSLTEEQRADFKKAMDAATVDCSQLLSAERVEAVKQYGHISCAAGQKVSRVVNKLCLKLGFDKLEVERECGEPGNRTTRRVKPYNAAFARLADALNPVCISKTAVLSIHPCDFLEMSNKDNEWKSCHRLDGGGYQGGCLSYLGDGVSMIFFTVDEAVKKDFHKAPRLTREIFCYKDGLLLQSRLYPENNADTRTLYRHTVQQAVARCLGQPNLWKSRAEQELVDSYCKTAENSLHYPDYSYDYGILSFLKGQEVYFPMTIGSVAHCVGCGKEHTDHHSIKCGGCANTVVCKQCGKTIHRTDAHYWEGSFFCDDCAPGCAACHDRIRGRIYPAFDKSGSLRKVCEACYSLVTEHCGECSARAVCGLLHGVQFCPNSRWGFVAAAEERTGDAA